MALGTQLSVLVDMLRNETGQSGGVAVGIANLPMLKQTLMRTQTMLYEEYDWPHLRVQPYVPLQAGQRYYDMPTTLNFDRIERVYVWYSNIPHPMERGITPIDYAHFNSELGVRADPTLKWNLQWTGSKTQLEVWPIPASNTMRMQFVGIRPLNPLIADSDTCDLDDDLIVLYAAAEVLARFKSADAPAKASLAKKRFDQIKKRYAAGGGTDVVLGGGKPEPHRRHGTTIRVSGQVNGTIPGS